MNKSSYTTKQILKKIIIGKNTINSQTKILNLSDLDIRGTLDLSRFRYLEELDCSNNLITNIINLPRRLKKLDCSNNLIEKFHFNLGIIKYINMQSNPIKNLTWINHIDFGIDKLSQLESIYYNNKFNSSIDILSQINTLKKIRFGEQFNKSVNNLPNSIEILIFGRYFNQPVNNLPCSLTHITFGYEFNQPIDNLPTGLKYIRFTIASKFKQSIDNLPNSLEYLLFGYLCEFSGSLENLPNSIKKIIISDKKYTHESLLYFSNNYNITKTRYGTCFLIEKKV